MSWTFIYNSYEYFLVDKVSDETEMMQTAKTKVLVTLNYEFLQEIMRNLLK